MSLNPELIPVKKDKETIRRDVLNNVVKMIYNRELIDDKSIIKILEDIKKNSNDDIYKIKLIKNIKPDSDNKEYIKKFDGTQIIIKIIHQKVQGISKMPVIKDFLIQYQNNHKIFIFDGISDKAKSNLTDNLNVEVFNESFFMLNLVEHVDSPEFKLLTEEEEKEVMDSYILKKKEIKKILTTDPVVHYFNIKRGNIIKIIRPSEQSGKSVDYRIVAKGNI